MLLPLAAILSLPGLCAAAGDGTGPVTWNKDTTTKYFSRRTPFTWPYVKTEDYYPETYTTSYDWQTNDDYSSSTSSYTYFAIPVPIGFIVAICCYVGRRRSRDNGRTLLISRSASGARQRTTRCGWRPQANTNGGTARTDIAPHMSSGAPGGVDSSRNLTPHGTLSAQRSTAPSASGRLEVFTVVTEGDNTPPPPYTELPDSPPPSYEDCSRSETGKSNASFIPDDMEQKTLAHPTDETQNASGTPQTIGSTLVNGLQK